jgi:murein DD-endopeptidase MepM/ murein hydrolase activator NlpD
MIPFVFFTFCAGLVIGWVARGPITRTVLSRVSDVTLPSDRDASPARAGIEPTRTGVESNEGRADASDPIEALRARNLHLPIDDADIDAMKGQFGEGRDNGQRGHEAVDILAARNTPIHAVEDGTIAKLFLSKPGGITVYQFDPSGRFCYYYAHLEKYADGLHDEQRVSRGEVLGYVGTSGNAPADTPHLHFAVFELTPERHWWQGTPLDPWLIFRR